MMRDRFDTQLELLNTKLTDMGTLCEAAINSALERIGDHATNIAEWVEFSITGQHAKEE